jgi:hypothetical protein
MQIDLIAINEKIERVWSPDGFRLHKKTNKKKRLPHFAYSKFENLIFQLQVVPQVQILPKKGLISGIL